MSQITYVSNSLTYVIDMCVNLLEIYVLEIYVSGYICVRLIYVNDMCQIT